jgi:type VI secretion system protein ImpK
VTAPAHADAGTARRGQLALLLQELLTATVRLRANPEESPADAEPFRAQVRRLITAANSEARRIGYGEHDVGYALYAVVAFLDETVLTLGRPVFRSWQGKPLQEEVFGINVGGDVFFQYVEALLAREDSEDLADVLEVFQLCLLLGFRGRYGAAQAEVLHTWTARIRDRITRIRGAPSPMAPHWAPPANELAPRRSGDPVQRRLLALLVALVVFTGALFFVLRLTLARDTRAVAGLVSS